MKVYQDGKPTLYWVTGIEEGGTPCPAYAQKVSDSGGGSSLLIYGGLWGIRFKPVEDEQNRWDFGDSRQWGEPYKFYADERDLVYGG